MPGDLLGGLVAGLYSIPEGIGYAQLALISPMMGIYSGMAPVAVAAIGAGTARMIATLTSAIALTVGGVVATGAISPAQVPSAVVTITLLAGIFMAVLGILRLGRIVNLISHSVMTGFIIGIGALIIVGKIPEVFGYKPDAFPNKTLEALDVLVHPLSWDVMSTAVGVGTVVSALVLQAIRPLRRFALLIVMAAGTFLVWVLHLTLPVVGDSPGMVSGFAALPIPTSLEQLPSPALMPQLALVALAVTVIALSEGAGIRPAFPNPDGRRSSPSRDFVAVGIANVVGSLFQSPPVGGSLSRTQLSCSSGARTRWAGIFAAVWLVGIVVALSPLIAAIPTPVIAGLLVVIGIEIIRGRRRDVAVAWAARWVSITMLTLTTVLVLVLPVQYAIAVPIAVSIAEFAVTSARRVRLLAFQRAADGWTPVPGPIDATLAAGEVTVLYREGPEFHAAVPALMDALPRPISGEAPGVLVLDLSTIMQLSDTFLEGLAAFAVEIADAGSGLVVVGVHPEPARRMARSGFVSALGEANVMEHLPRLGANLDAGQERGEVLLASLVAAAKINERR